MGKGLQLMSVFRTVIATRSFKIGAGVAVGALFLWLALRQVDLPELRRAFTRLAPMWCILSLALYWSALAIRVVRWRYILNAVTTLTLKQVTLALLTGYAVNAILPARLGELFRAEFCRQRYVVPRSTTLGTILVERLTDGLIVLASLFVGLLALDAGEVSSQFTSVLIGGLMIVGSVGVALVAVGSSWTTKLILRLPRADRLIAFQDSVRVLRRRRIIGVLVLSVAVWLFDGGALWAILRAAGADVGFLQLCLVLGVVSLSTLLPSPPGFLGTMQFAFVLSLQAFQFPPSQAIVAATANQVLLIGSMVAVGLTILGGSQVRTVLSRFWTGVEQEKSSA